MRFPPSRTAAAAAVRTVPAARPSGWGEPARRRWLALGLGLLVLLGAGLGARGLNEPDEGRYADIARAMVVSGDWWEPRLSGWGHYDKPPLVYWITAVCLRVGGTNEWAARLPSLLGAALALAGLGWLAARRHGPRVAWWAVLIGGTLAQFWVCARLLTPDMLLTGWCTLAAGAWAEVRWRLRRGGPGARFPWGWWAAGLACWTLGWWTKATAALVPLLGLTVALWCRGDRAGRRALRLGWLLPALLLLGSPWYLAMLHRHPDLREFFLGRELGERLAGDVDGRRASLFYYVPICLVGWLPWWPLALRPVRGWRRPARGVSAALPGARHPAWWRRQSRRLPVEVWVAGVGLAVFSLVHSKLPTYSLVLAPWVALALARRLAGPRAGSFRGPAGLPAAGTFARRRPPVGPAGRGWLAAFGAVVLAGAVAAPRFESRWGQNASTREVCGFLAARGARVVYSDRYLPGAEFYLGESRVHYVIEGERRQRPSDPGPDPDRFLDPRGWSLASVRARRAAGEDLGCAWFLRYRKNRKTAFRRTPPAGWELAGGILRPVRPEPAPLYRFGDFEVWSLAQTAGLVER